MYYFQDLSESSVTRDGADDVIYAGILTTFQLTARSTTGKKESVWKWKYDSEKCHDGWLGFEIRHMFHH